MSTPNSTPVNGVAPHGPVIIHRLVLLALLIPILALGLVLWLLLPGGVAGITYAPQEYSQAVQVQTAEWRSRQISIRGYVDRFCPDTAHPTQCDAWVLLDQPSQTPLNASTAAAGGALQILIQHESSLHAILRKVLPGLARPFPQGARVGALVTVTGKLDHAHTRSGVPTFAPNDL